MVKVYANEVGHVIVSEQLVDLILTLQLLKSQEERVYRAALKELSNQVREELEIDNLISLLILNESTVGVLVFNIMADTDDFYKQGEDEIGVYLAIGEEEEEDMVCGVDCDCFI
ncbi:hypothetical protein [Paenibacillus agilis]|uniref:Uncharacterized protein n=1 Tax=Paenibacillus agilis TaxID=3020863 RepID=A0A559IEB1_9BACL|nr:hypothetical protein [Paenibacillus agilis]TVX85999.1 hypothetical protein FPZ44_23920 [Paenibacillus agilis]